MKSLAAWWAKPIVRWGVGIIFGALSLYLALRNISGMEVWQAFQYADWAYMGLASVSVTTGVIAKGLRWRVLLGENGRKVGLIRLVMTHLAGQSLNMIYPARMGDISRVYVLGALGISRMFTLGTIILEKLWDLLSYSLVFIILLLLIPMPTWVSESGYGLAVVTITFFIASFLISYNRMWVVRVSEWLVRRLPEKYHGQFLERIHIGFTSLDVLQSREDLFWLTIWSTVIWATAVLNNYLVLLALNIRLPITASVLILVALQAGISLPTTPGRLGVFQYICVLVLSIYGIDRAMAFSYSILLHTVALLTILFAGLVCVWALSLVDHRLTRRKFWYG